ncbi:MAG: hypothetical protein ABIQ10_13005 [Gemmatimonadaceae bacterium]
MSDQAPATEPTSRSVAILGADALIVALPSTPTQLANACFAGGFAEVFPATWGDELIASGCLEQLESRTGPAIFCACPLVAEQLRGAAELRRFIVPLISPPVAVARYLRALFPDESLRITYVGDCPGADDAIIDERLSPHELLSTLAKRGILPATQRPDLGTHAAHDRRRFYSIPGGVPSPQWLAAQWPKRTLVDVHAGDALATLARQTMTRGNTLIDFAPHLGCACAGAVGGTNAQDSRAAVVAHEPPRALSEIVDAAVRVEVSLAPAADRNLPDVTWNDFLAALPAALAMHPEGATTPIMQPASRTAPRRALQRKAALPRAYMAARQGARRDRSAPRTPVRPGTTQELKHAVRAKSEVAAARETAGAPVELELSRRDEITAARPNAWIARRASHESMTGPRNLPAHRTGLATADRWLIAGLMLTSSVLVAVLTSALTVRGMEQSGAPLATPSVASRNDAVTTVAAAPVVVVRDTTSIIRPPRASDSVIVASAPRADSAPQHEDGGAVAPPPTSALRLSPMPARVARVTSEKTEKHEPPRTARRTISVAEHMRAAPPEYSAPIMQTMLPPAAPPPSPVTSAPTTAPVATPAQPVVQQPVPTSAPATLAATPPAATPASAPAANNAQFLEELRAIHAEIDARKKHMDSLTASLDSLKRIKP